MVNLQDIVNIELTQEDLKHLENCLVSCQFHLLSGTMHSDNKDMVQILQTIREKITKHLLH